MSKKKKSYQKAKQSWKESFDNSISRNYNFDTLSGKKLDPLYFPEKPSEDYLDQLGFPGQFPFTRAVSYTHLRAHET